MAGFGRRKGKEDLICNYNLKNKGNNKIFSERNVYDLMITIYLYKSFNKMTHVKFNHLLFYKA